jgi:hypothetical protein
MILASRLSDDSASVFIVSHISNIAAIRSDFWVGGCEEHRNTIGRACFKTGLPPTLTALSNLLPQSL